jgi:uncharacterized membrane protein
MTTVTDATRAGDEARSMDASMGANGSSEDTRFGHRAVPDGHDYAVLLAAFEDEEAASSAGECRSQLGRQGATIRDVATLRTDACGVVHVQNLTGGSTRKGLAAGMLGGLATGVLLSPPLAVSMVGLGLAGAVVGKLRYEYRKAGTGAALLGVLRPNTSALLAIVKAEDASNAAAVLPANSSIRTAYVDSKAAGHLSQVARRIE